MSKGEELDLKFSGDPKIIKETLNKLGLSTLDKDVEQSFFKLVIEAIELHSSITEEVLQGRTQIFSLTPDDTQATFVKLPGTLLKLIQRVNQGKTPTKDIGALYK